MELWWEDCQTSRMVNQGPRKEYQRRSQHQSESSDEEEELALEDCDRWFGPPLPQQVVEFELQLSILLCCICFQLLL